MKVEKSDQLAIAPQPSKDDRRLEVLATVYRYLLNDVQRANQPEICTTSKPKGNLASESADHNTSRDWPSEIIPNGIRVIT